MRELKLWLLLVWLPPFVGHCGPGLLMSLSAQSTLLAKQAAGFATPRECQHLFEVKRTEMVNAASLTLVVSLALSCWLILRIIKLNREASWAGRAVPTTRMMLLTGLLMAGLSVGMQLFLYQSETALVNSVYRTEMDKCR